MQGLIPAQDSFYPENWIASTTRASNNSAESTEGFSEVLIHGEKHYLKDLFAQYPVEILGALHVKKYGAVPQVLVKLLDSAERLYLQAHPTATFARQHLRSNSGKTEAYVILEIRPEVAQPYVYMGFQRQPDRKIFRELILHQDVPALLSYFDKIPVRVGDVFIIPGGLPHASGEGILMVEIMEPTDFYVRAEFSRGDMWLAEDKRYLGRDVEFALAMFDYTVFPLEEIHRRYFQVPKLITAYNATSAEYALIDERVTNCFRLKKLVVQGSICKNSEHSFYAGIVARGTGEVHSGSDRLELRRGDAFLIPFAADAMEYESTTGMEIVLALPPEV